jgi:hypothetical protein
MIWPPHPQWNIKWLTKNINNFQEGVVRLHYQSCTARHPYGHSVHFLRLVYLFLPLLCKHGVRGKQCEEAVVLLSQQQQGRTRLVPYCGLMSDICQIKRFLSLVSWLSRLVYNKPSLIRLQLIRMSHNPDRNMKNSVHSWVHLGARGIRARGLSDCVADAGRDWNHAKKISNIGLSWMKETLTEEEIAALIFFIYLFSSALLI